MQGSTGIIEYLRVRFVGGIWLDDRTRQCTIYDNNHALGFLFTQLGLFAAYVLFLRPDIYKEVNALIWIFRVIFPFGFGLAGLAMLVNGIQTIFDVKRGTFMYATRSLFRLATLRNGGLCEVTRIVLDASCETSSTREAGQDRMLWCFTLSMDICGEKMTLREWRCAIAGTHPHDEAVVAAKSEAERVARFIDRPLALGWEMMPS